MCYSGQEENDGIGSLGYATLKEVESKFDGLEWVGFIYLAV